MTTDGNTDPSSHVDALMPRRLAPLLLLSPALLACDPRWVLRATIVDHVGSPVEGAHLQASCLPSASYVSDAAGRIEADEIGSIEGTCVLLVTKRGYRTVTTKAKDACTAWNSVWIGGCRDLRLEVTLTPVP